MYFIYGRRPTETSVIYAVHDSLCVLCTWEIYFFNALRWNNVYSISLVCMGKHKRKHILIILLQTYLSSLKTFNGRLLPIFSICIFFFLIRYFSLSEYSFLPLFAILTLSNISTDVGDDGWTNSIHNNRS